MTTEVPPAVAAEIAAIADKPREGARLRKLVARSRERGGSADDILAWSLAGIAGDPVAYRRFDEKLTELFRNRSNLNMPADGGYIGEMVIGSGYHAAVICALRSLQGYPKPFVFESSPEVGGALAVTANPSFFLNSEITGGPPGAPWDEGANNLNWLPGGPVQASQVTGREIPDNTVMRFIIRAALIMHARVITRATVLSVSPRSNGCLRVSLSNGRTFLARRVFDARGMGVEKKGGADGVRILTWSQAMLQMDRDWPFDGMRRVAVIGNGKSALCAVEAVLGIGPDVTLRSHAGGGVADRVDLYAPGLPSRRELWADGVPSRYIRLGSHLPTGLAGNDDDDGDREELRGYGQYHDLTVRQEQGFPLPVPGGVMVNGRFYDCAITCTGHDRPPDLVIPAGAPGPYEFFTAGGRKVASRVPGLEYYRVGPCADLPWAPPDYASGITVNPDNRVAMHRLGPLTATLVSSLPPLVPLRGTEQPGPQAEEAGGPVQTVRETGRHDPHGRALA